MVPGDSPGTPSAVFLGDDKAQVEALASMHTNFVLQRRLELFESEVEKQAFTAAQWPVLVV